MKKIFPFIILLVFAACKKDDGPKQYDNLQDALNSDAPLGELIQQFSPSEFYGMDYHGGQIFYINAGTGLVMMAGPEDINEENSQFTGAPWRLDIWGVSVNNLPADIGKGNANTEAIVETYEDGYYAARLCYDYEHAGRSDWFLPSLNELEKMYENLHLNEMGDFNGEACYWSSSGGSSDAWYLFFYNGNQEEFGSLGTFYVRPVRSETF